jgi:UDP-sugar transporter A1/2/3
LKGSQTTLWVRNIQLGTLGFIGSIAISLLDYDIIQSKGFFYKWDYLTVLVVLNQAIGGLVVAIVVKYADSIMKGFAVSISIIINSLISFLFFGFEIHFLFFIGTLLVLGSVYMYGLPNQSDNTIQLVSGEKIRKLEV